MQEIGEIIPSDKQETTPVTPEVPLFANDETFRELVDFLVNHQYMDPDLKDEIEFIFHFSLSELKRRMKSIKQGQTASLGITDQERSNVLAERNIDLYRFPCLAQILFYNCYFSPALTEETKKNGSQIASLILINTEQYYERGLDPLTGLKNRLKLGEALNKHEQAWQERKSNYAILMLDIDKFKKVNDTYGHKVGDDVLKYFSDILVKSIRGRDGAYRYGGEEFVLIINDGISYQNVHLVLERLKAELKNPFILPNGDELFITFSGGLAVQSQHPDLSVEELLKGADLAMYVVKKTTRNDVREFTQETKTEQSKIDSKQNSALTKLLAAGRALLEGVLRGKKK